MIYTYDIVSDHYTLQTLYSLVDKGLWVPRFQAITQYYIRQQII